MSSSSLTVPTENLTRPVPETSPAWLDVVEKQINGLKFGSVHITVHEGRVVQVETSVRVRFEKSPA